MRSTLIFVATLALAACSGTPTNPATNGGGATSISHAATESRIDTALGHGGSELSATLTGAAERPGPGDPDGTGSARITVNSGQGEVCFHLEVSGVDPITAAHIHVGSPAVAGPIVVPLNPPPTGGSSTGCVAADEELIRQIRNNPEAYYVNVHNAPFPAGALRGQLSH